MLHRRKAAGAPIWIGERVRSTDLGL